jgi:hypothetical protein
MFLITFKLPAAMLAVYCEAFEKSVMVWSDSKMPTAEMPPLSYTPHATNSWFGSTPQPYSKYAIVKRFWRFFI